MRLLFNTAAQMFGVVPYVVRIPSGSVAENDVQAFMAVALARREALGPSAPPVAIASMSAEAALAVA